MDSHNGESVSGTRLSYSSSPSSASRPAKALNSPNSPFSTISDSQEQHSSQELTSFEANSYATQPSHHPRGDAWPMRHPDPPIASSPLKRHKTNDLSYLKNLLVACAIALDENDVESFNTYITVAKASVSVTGDPIQRLGAYLIEALMARKNGSGANICRALQRSKDAHSHIMYEVCPYVKFGYMAANGAIADACKDESRIHIIDFQIERATQWTTLLQALAAHPRGPPHVRITAVDDPTSPYSLGDGLEAVSKRLIAISTKFHIHVGIHVVTVPVSKLRKEMLEVRDGEALVVNFPLQLHRTADESVDVENPRDGILRMMKSLNPKVTTLVEQESNTNTAPFRTRFAETYEYYMAMFESIDAMMSRNAGDRVVVEQQRLAWDIVNVVACEGRERGERHELFGKWRSRFKMAGFRPYPLKTYVNVAIRELLNCYSDAYTLEERDGALLLGWKRRNLISASAWR